MKLVKSELYKELSKISSGENCLKRVTYKISNTHLKMPKLKKGNSSVTDKLLDLMEHTQLVKINDTEYTKLQS